MIDNHVHRYRYPTLRILTLEQPDGYYRILVERWCRECGMGESLTGIARRSPTLGTVLPPPMDTFWHATRQKEE